jgi:hypothetical protein
MIVLLPVRLGTPGGALERSIDVLGEGNVKAARNRGEMPAKRGRAGDN